MMIIILISIIVILLLAFFLIGNFFYNFALNSKIDKAGVLQNNEFSDDFNKDHSIIAWFEDNKKIVNMKSYTGVDLTGYIVEQDSSNLWAIILHGYAQDGNSMSTFAKKFYDLGFNVLVPDLLGHGSSGGNTISMGGLDSIDLVKWADKITIEYEDPRIIFFGVSMGAATVLNSLDKNPVNNVVAFIEDSGYINLDEIFSYQLKKLFKLPRFLVIPAADFVTKFRGKFSFKDVNAEGGILKTKLPGLILHGDKDDFVLVDNAIRIHKMLNSEKEIQIFEDAIHVEAAFKYPDEYWSKVEDFINKYVR